MAVVNEVITKFKFIGSTQPLGDFNQNLGSAVKLLGGFATASLAAAGLMSKWTQGVVAAVQPMNDLNAQIGISVERQQELRYVAESSGVGVDTLTSSLKRLNKRAGDAALGGGAAVDTYKKLGITLRDENGNVKNADALLKEVQASLRGYSDAEKVSMMEKLGINRNMIAMMNLSQDEMDGLISRAQQLGTLNEQQAEALDNYDAALTDQRYAMDGLRQMVAVSFAPMLQELTNGFIDVLISNRDWITKGLEYLGKVVLGVTGFLSRMWPVLASIGAAAFIAFGGVSKLAGVFTLLTSPVFLIGIAIAALLLVVDDLITAFQGGQSVIADFFQEFFGVDIVPMLHEIVDTVINIGQRITDIIMPLIGYVTDIFQGLISFLTGDFDGAMKHFSDAWVNWTVFVDNLFQGIWDLFTTVGTAAWDLILGVATGIIESVATAFSRMWDNVKQYATDIFTSFGNWLSNLISGLVPDWVKSAAGGVSSVATGISDTVSGWFSGGSNTSSNVSQENTINIYGDNAQMIGESVADNLTDQMGEADIMSGRGGR